MIVRSSRYLPFYRPRLPGYNPSTLSDICTARGHPIPLAPAHELEGSTSQRSSSSPASLVSLQSHPHQRNSLNHYLQNHHPSLIRLPSPRPSSPLEIEYVSWSRGTKFADIHRRIRQKTLPLPPAKSGTVESIDIFCNKNAKLIELIEYLERQDVKCLPMTSASEHREMGSNRRLAQFMKKPSIIETVSKKKALKRLRRDGDDVSTLEGWISRLR
jgi:ATP-dependent RNA helicase MRH4